MIREMESTQERVVSDLIELWADVYSTEIYFVQGKRFTARQLKPYVKAALAEPGSSVQAFFETSPEIARACATYADLPTGLRKIILILARKEIEDKLYLFKRLFHLFAVLYITGRITAAETERRLEQSFKHVLDRITLKELLNKPDESNLHTLLEALPLFPGSIAGADRRLKSVLVSHCKEVSEPITYYEQDLKAALWNCWKVKHVDEAIKMLSKQGDPTEKMSMLRRIMDGQEPQLLRTMLLRMLRKTIEELPDIHQEIRSLRTPDREVPLTEETLAALPPKHNQYETAFDNLLDMLSQRKVDISRLDTRSLNLLNKELNRIKFGMSRRQYYGQDEDRIKQQFKRLSDKLKTEAG